jgi:hypothetical protein
VSDEWLITEHSPNVAAQFADRWATSVAAQARRIHRPENAFERVPDTFLQVVALRQLTRAAEMAKDAAEPEAARRRIQEAIDSFLGAIVVEMNTADRAEAFKLARDVLEHFDEYCQGRGREQRRTARDDPSLGREDLAQRYRVELAGPSADRPHLSVGPLRPAEPLVVIDLVERAPSAARQLAAALGFGHGGWAPL